MARSMMAGAAASAPDRLPDLRSLDLPVLVIAGEHDMPGFVDGSQAMADAIPGAMLAVLDGAAHSPQLETPDAWTAVLPASSTAGRSRPHAPRRPLPTTQKAAADMTTTAPSHDDAGSVPAAADLTLDEQAALTAGADMWHTAGVERLGVAGHRR